MKDAEKERKTSIYKTQQTVPMENPPGILGPRFDPNHFDEISHEKLVLSEWMQNWDPLPKIFSWKKQGDWKSQISEATSRGSERFFSSACWGRNELFWAQENQEQSKQLAQIRRTPLPSYLKLEPLALMLFLSEGCHHDTITHWYPLQCDGARQLDPNKHADHSQTCSAQVVPTRLPGAYTERGLMLSAMATDSLGIVSPESERNFLCVKCGLETKSRPQSRTPRSSLCLMAIRSRFVMNL